MWGWLKSVFGNTNPAKDNRQIADEPSGQISDEPFDFSENGPETEPESGPENENARDHDDPSYAATYAAVDAYWGKVGKVDADVIAYIINPEFSGAPPWPSSRQAFKIIRTSDSLIIASDGLCDPFRDDKNEMLNGFEMEVFIEAKGLQNLAFDEISASPEFTLIEQVARQVAGWGGITQLLEKVGVASSEIPISSDKFPDKFITSEEYIGILFGMEAAGRPQWIPDTPLSPVRMAPVTALTSKEVAQAAQGAAERNHLVEQLKENGIGHITDFSRESIF